MTWNEWLHDMWFGYQSSLFNSLQTKGLSNMIELIALIALAGALQWHFRKVSYPRDLYAKAARGDIRFTPFCDCTNIIFGLGLGLVSCTQTLPIMMTGRNLLPFWEKRFPRSQLAELWLIQASF